MRIVLSIFLLVFISCEKSNDEESIDINSLYTTTTIPKDSRYEIVQGYLFFKHTLRLDKYTGDVYQLIFDESKWKKIEQVPNWSFVPKRLNQVNYQFFISNTLPNQIFLLNIYNGDTWKLITKSNSKLGWKVIESD